MEEDEGVSKAAAMWGLKEAIENFPVRWFIEHPV